MWLLGVHRWTRKRIGSETKSHCSGLSRSETLRRVFGSVVDCVKYCTLGLALCRSCYLWESHWKEGPFLCPPQNGISLLNPHRFVHVLERDEEQCSFSMEVHKQEQDWMGSHVQSVLFLFEKEEMLTDLTHHSWTGPAQVSKYWQTMDYFGEICM